MEEEFKPKQNKAIKISFSIIGGIICGILAYFVIAISFMSLIAGSHFTALMIVLVTLLISATGLFVWGFLKSPNIKKMWGRICISIGIIILFFPLSTFIGLSTSLAQHGGLDSDAQGMAILVSGASSICIGIFAVFMAIGFIIGAYFLLKKD